MRMDKLMRLYMRIGELIRLYMRTGGLMRLYMRTGELIRLYMRMCELVTSCGVFGDSLIRVRLQRRGDLDLFLYCVSLL